jgi:hypothetical protein
MKTEFVAFCWLTQEHRLGCVVTPMSGTDWMRNPMTSAARSLFLTILLYLAALSAVAAGLYGSLSVVVPAVQAHFLKSAERTPSRLDYLVADARAIRQALATPIAPAEPLPRITARPLQAPTTVAVKPEHERRASSTRVSRAARDAYAMPERAGGGATTMTADRYRPL